MTGEQLDAIAHEHGWTRSRIIEFACRELGPGRSSDYWRDVLRRDWVGPYPPHWCGAFCLWAMHQAGIAKDVHWEVGKGFLWRLPRTKDPKPGDVAYFDRLQHHALVAEVVDGRLLSIDGNQPDVRARARPLHTVTAFYSIEHWLPVSDTEPPAEDPPETEPAPAPEGNDDGQIT